MNKLLIKNYSKYKNKETKYKIYIFPIQFSRKLKIYRLYNFLNMYIYIGFFKNKNLNDKILFYICCLFSHQ